MINRMWPNLETGRTDWFGEDEDENDDDTQFGHRPEEAQGWDAVWEASGKKASGQIMLQHVWKEVPNLSCLLFLLGSVLNLTEGEPVKLSRTLVLSDWTRFNFHAPFVKSLTITDIDIQDFDPSTFDEIIRYFHEQCILPHLTSINLGQGAALTPAIHRLSFGPSIRKVETTILSPCSFNQQLAPNQRSDAYYDGIFALLHSLPARCSDIDDLSVSIRPLERETASVHDALATTLGNLQGIRSLALNIEGPSIPLLQAISQLLHLRWLRLLSLRSDVPWEPLSSSFRAVECLEILGDCAPCATILGTIAASTMKSLRIAVYPSAPDPPPMPPLKIVSRLSNLREIQLDFDFKWTRWEHFQPLLKCSRLRLVRLVCPRSSLDIDDGTVEEMARSWPELRELNVAYCWGDQNDWDGIYGWSADDRAAPPITLTGLACFGGLCPYLSSLTISVDARPENQKQSLSDHLPLLSLRKANLAYSMVGAEQSASAIANMIDRMWPNLEVGWTDWCSGQPEYDGDEEFVNGREEMETWKAVWEATGKQDHWERHTYEWKDVKIYYNPAKISAVPCRKGQPDPKSGHVARGPIQGRDDYF
ncbi:hypothetical protein FRB97_006687 [Tulasnella sp. 331]|nr:hypothetical protein FRB97_006687 [Tulasnella sp. 331]